MRKDFLNNLAIAITSMSALSCAGIGLNIGKNYQDASKVRQNTAQYIDEGKFTVARDYLKKLESHDDWCNGSAPNDYCNSRQPNPVANLLKSVDQAESCNELLKKCTGLGESRNDLDQCVVDLDKQCAYNEAIGERKYMAAAEALSKKLTSQRFLKKFTAQTDSLVAKKLAAKQNQCLDNLKWGYYRQGESNVLYGHHISQAACDEARLNDSKSGGSYGDRCRVRISGKKEVAQIVQVEFMHDNSYDRQPIKNSINFSSMATCEQTIAEPFEYMFKDPVKKVQIAPFGSPEPIRVISKCKMVDTVVCQPGSEVIQEIEFFR